MHFPQIIITIAWRLVHLSNVRLNLEWQEMVNSPSVSKQSYPIIFTLDEVSNTFYQLYRMLDAIHIHTIIIIFCIYQIYSALMLKVFLHA